MEPPAVEPAPEPPVHDKIVSILWNIGGDILGDAIKRAKYPNVVLPMCVLCRLDAVLETKHVAVVEIEGILDRTGITEQNAALCQASGQAFYNTSKFTLRGLNLGVSQRQLRRNFEAYLDGLFTEHPGHSRSFQIPQNTSRHYRGAEVLGPLIDAFLDPAFSLSPDPVLNGDGSMRHPALDNQSMATVFEQLAQRFNEINIAEAGEHWTPSDVSKLMADLLFLPVAGEIQSGSYRLYDGACGTGGLLTSAEGTLRNLAEKRGKRATTRLYGQETDPRTYATCKAAMLLKGEDEHANTSPAASSAPQFPATRFRHTSSIS